MPSQELQFQSQFSRTEGRHRCERGASLRGELDIASAPTVVDALCRQLKGPFRTIEVDLAEVTFMDCRGIAACEEAQSRAREAGYKMVFVNPPARVLRVIKLLDLEMPLLRGFPS